MSAREELKLGIRDACFGGTSKRMDAHEKMDARIDALVAEAKREERETLAKEMREVEAGRQKQAPPLTGDLYSNGLHSGWMFAVQYIEDQDA